MIFSSNVLKRWSFQKELSWGMTFLVLSGRWYFFPKNMIFFLERKVRDDLSQKIHGNMIFSVCTHGCYKRGTTPLLPPPPLSRKSKMVLSHKNTLKGDLLSRFTFQKELGQFSVLSWRPLQALSCIALQRKNPGNLIHSIEV